MIPIFCRLRAANSARLSHGSRRLQICRSPSIFVERQKYHRRVLTVGHKCGILILALIRRCGGMVDTGDLKSPGSNTVPVRVRSPAPSGKTIYRGVEQLVARRAHNPEVGGSSPPSATMLCNQKRYCTGKPRNHNGFWAFSYPDFQVQTKRYFSLLRGLELPTPTISGGFQEDFSSESRLFFVFAENFF